MSRYEQVKSDLLKSPKSWLVTGCAGFIGSHLLEKLLKLNQHVVGLDNFSTGKQQNLEEVRSLVPPEQWTRFRFIEGDVRHLETCHQASTDVDYVLHQAAVGSVPRSIEDPLRTHDNNVNGFINMLLAALDQKVRRFVYASSSSVYGDNPDLPKVEDKVGRPLSPYAASKAVCEMYADVFARTYRVEAVGLRYFNVFGPRQDPEGPYAAVIPKWIRAMLNGEEVYINGDGDTSRDFSYVDNVVQANLLAATAPASEAFACRAQRLTLKSQLTAGPSAFNSQPSLTCVYNVAVGERLTLNRLHELISERVCELNPGATLKAPVYREARTGDVKHSVADISRAKEALGYAPTHRAKAAIKTVQHI